ncbi:MAG: aminoglycoside phosphotransferase family protein [Bacillota bacterium]|nr:aminoglycoside phosphotransferase family protein [Bacillota bacterium]
MSKGKLIGKGMTAEVYEWERDRVLKLYFERFSDEWIAHEAKVGSILNDAGAPSPKTFGLTEVDGRKGLIIERIYGKSIMKHLETEPWKLFYYAKKIAALQYQIHGCTAEGLPSQEERFLTTMKRASRILGDRIPRIMEYIQRLPNPKSICHGDLHFKNIMDTDGKLVAIDWNSAYLGDPLSDVARTCIIMKSPSIPDGISEIMSIPIMYTKWLTYSTFVSEYMKIAKVKIEDIEAWMLPAAASRLKDKIPGETKWLMDMIDKRLDKLKKT